VVDNIQSDQVPNLEAAGSDNTPQQGPSLTPAAIQAWLIAYLAAFLEIDLQEVDPSTPFERYGLDSAAAIGVTCDIEDWLGRELDPALLYEYPTITELAQHLASDR
jgi:acyl carrier protein